MAVFAGGGVVGVDVTVCTVSQVWRLRRHCGCTYIHIAVVKWGFWVNIWQRERRPPSAPAQIEYQRKLGSACGSSRPQRESGPLTGISAWTGTQTCGIVQWPRICAEDHM